MSLLQRQAGAQKTSLSISSHKISVCCKPVLFDGVFLPFSTGCEQFKTQAKVEGQWTIFGLAQELQVHRNWLYTRIHKGTLPATRHSVTGHYLIADEPEILATLRAQRDRCCYR